MALEYELSVPEGARSGAPLIILLHGRGSDRFNVLGLRGGFPADAIFVAPNAPFPAAPWGYGPGSAWYRYLGDDRPEPESFERSQEELAEFIRTLPERLPVEVGATVLGGFSQGGTMSLAHALMFPGAVSHVMNFSGFLANHPRVTLDSGGLDGVKIFWGHGTHDPAIPFQMAESGRRRLEQAGADMLARNYPIGHWIDPDELADAVQWLGESVGESRAGEGS